MHTVARPNGVDLAGPLERMRREAPLVQCLTNAVVTNVTANALLAAGAAPVMADLPGEAGECAVAASAVLVNVGTPHDASRVAMREAVAAARASGTPWVLDPVGVGALTLRTGFARELLADRPAAIRGNASEIRALAGEAAAGRGVDATCDVDAALSAARRLARETGAVVAVSGPQDLVVARERELRISGGSAWLTRMTGGGCSLGAVVAALVACAADAGPSAAVAAAHALYAEASERAAGRADGPGSFAVAFLDALAEVAPADLASRPIEVAA
ncbi:hydroxyethylthiazole kinase [Microbacterium sp. ZXX196]|uniref:hydroxyethylthiazole kinase n=1 Tax=Microbacterium sp. ZXX196 TaxID=2609291 RepID=UPI0012B77EE7|nr:hydroxyethylthiazole kinase [Microbacterium sp. ZXX196]MTE22856.1 hydroxyethylthiazole kinase [Microbacterium sp. ZXX196]